jgi:hypothetical protein
MDKTTQLWLDFGGREEAALLEPDIRELFVTAGVTPDVDLIETLGLLVDGAYWSGRMDAKVIAG